ncbi:MAG: ATP-dependent helicase HrpB [Rhodospirillales bacterium]
MPDLLPIDPKIPEILAALEARGAAVLQAPPGAGKTTRVPLAIAAHPAMAGRKVVVLEPRRLAARLAAGHMATVLGEAPGERVGYRVRLDRKVGPKTQVELVTDGLFLRQLQEDPELTGVGCLLFDEVHERGLESDLALALALEARAALRPDLWLLAMSATLEAEPWCALLGDAPLIAASGRQHPIDLRWRPPGPGERLERSVQRVVAEALRTDPGSLLVFLPGQAEIRRAQQAIEAASLPPDCDLAPLYGDLGRGAQAAALRPAPDGRRKIVLATAIAETSLTIEGIAVVIDGGLARQPRYDPRSGMTRLETLPVSRATATQRAGRAGRLGPGICYRLWEEAEHRARPAQPTPEILCGDPVPLALELALWGGGEDLAFLDPPPTSLLQPARDLLRALGALDEAGRVTPHGRELGRLGLHPRLAQMVLAGARLGEGRSACRLAALLSGRDLLRGTLRSDLRQQMSLLEDSKAGAAGLDRAAVREAQAVARQLDGQLGSILGRERRRGEGASLGQLLALAYPDRLAKRQAQEAERTRYRLANGRPAEIASDDPLALEPWLAVADLGGGTPQGLARIRRAAPIAVSEIEALFEARIGWQRRVAWDPAAKVVVAREERRLGALALATRPLAAPAPEELLLALAEGLRRAGTTALPWTSASRALQARLAFAAKHSGGDWPAVDDASLIADPAAWLGGQLWGLSKLSELQSLDLGQALLGLLTPHQRQALQRAAPARLSVPSGRDVPIDYASDPPVVSVKLQEMFGTKETPRIGEGKVALRIELLSPAGRPVAVSGDLAHFWAETYRQVRGEMRGRYPKHPWPEDPLQAVATARLQKHSGQPRKA